MSLLDFKLFKNISSLSIVHATGLLLPLIATPYLTRIFGVEIFGLFVLLKSLAHICSVVMDYGFNFTATRRMATPRKSSYSQSLLFTHILVIKIGFGLILAALGILSYFFYFSHNFSIELLFATLILGFGMGLSPLWYFQAHEKLAFPSFLFVLGNALFTGLLFFLVKQTDDLWIALSMQGVILMTITFFLSIGVFKKLGFSGLRWSYAKLLLADGWNVFVSHLAVQLYTSLNVVIISAVGGIRVAGIYGGAERLFKPIFSSIGPVSQAIFPRVSRLISEDFLEAKRFLKHGMIQLLAIAIPISVALCVFAQPLLHVILGPGFEDSVIVFQIGVFALPLVVISNGLGILWLIPNKKDKFYNFTLVSVGLLNVLILPALVFWFAEIGAAAMIIFLEILVIAMFIFWGRKSGKPLL